MEIILLENILNLGSIGDKVSVKNGYGRNFLLKKGKALRFNKENQDYVDKKKDVLNKKNTEIKNKFNEIAKLVNNKTFIFNKESKENGDLYGSIKPKEITQLIKIKAKADVNPSQIILKDDLKAENVEAIIEGCKNLEKHIANISKFGVPVVVGINEYITDTQEEHQAIIDFCKQLGVECKISSHWSNGGKGAADLAKCVANIVDSKDSEFKTLYQDDMPLKEKILHIAQSIYGADNIIIDKKVSQQLADFDKNGYGHYPICMAKTQYSFSTDPLLMGAPTGHDIPVREVRLCSGAEFIVVICGAIMTMPGLPRKPASENIGIDKDKNIEGLF